MTKLDDQIAQYRRELERPPGDSGCEKALFNLADALENNFLETNDIADLDEAIGLHRTALALSLEGHRDSHSLLFQLAWCLGERYRKQDTLPDLEEAITLGKAALDLRPEGHPSRSDSLHNLAVHLCDRYIKQDSIADLEEAIALDRVALELRPPGHSDRASTLYNLADNLRRKFSKLGATTDIDEAFLLHKSALDLRPEGHPKQSDSLYALALCLSDRHNKHASIADLEEAVRLCRAALELRPPGHSDRAWTLYNLANDLRCRFLKLGVTADLDEAILLYRSALDLRPEGHPDRSDSLYNLALYFSDRYDKQASIADLEEAITLSRAALELRPPGHSDRALALNNLGLNLRSRFLKRGVNADLDEALSLHRSALDLGPEGHPKQFDSLYTLALCLSDRYNTQASIADLEEAITLGRAALKLHSPGRSDLAPTLYNLGNDLRRRFLDLGATADLDEAILHHKSALNLRPVGHSDRLASLNQLVSCLGLRSEKLEALADLDDLIAFNRAILDLHPPGNKGRLKSIDELLSHLRKRGQKLDMTTDLEECITLGRIALGFHKPVDSGHATCFHYLVSDLRSLLRNLKNVFTSADSLFDHTPSLYNLLLCVRDVVSEGQVSTDVDELVAVVRAALKLCPPGHSVCIASFTTLTECLQHRFQKCGNTTDLDEAITLYKEVLKRCPSRSPDCASSLHKLAWCLSQKFIKLSTRSDLEDAIKFEEAASMLYPPSHPDRAESLGSLSNYLQMRIRGRVANPPPAHPISTHDSPQIQLICDTAFEVLRVSPPRLLYTHTGGLCNRDAQITHFKNSQEYRQLLSSASALDTVAQTAHIRGVVSTYFRYVTLSHRWGNSEPLLCNIEGRTIYDLGPTDGLSKLQSFCHGSLRRGYLWAWSDTCCMDRESSAELQESVGSMFSWYRQSALTMVHLADVWGTGTLTSSVWFKRGWTLQELLAPHFLLFFTQDWSLYWGISSNHKENSTILGELEQATGIASRHLTDFYPSVDDARSRLQWASTRVTTRPEDISYSLFGVFGLHIPVLYGESVGNALGRLLAEVISKSGETSILDWVGQSSSFHSCFPATITSYQTLPSQLPHLITPPNMRSIWNFLNLRSVYKMHQTLSNLPLTQFIDFRLILPCIIHRIKAIVLLRVGTSTGAYVYRILATGLKPIEIAISQPFEDLSEQADHYILIRPWNFNLLGPSVIKGATSAQRWLTRMQQPFSALLLKAQPQNEYKRVASICHILAHPTDFTGVLKGEVTTLIIV